MKKLIVIVIAMLPALAFSQSTLNDFISKYAGKSGFTSVNISPKMLSIASSLNLDDADLQALKDVTHMQILAHEDDADQAADLYNEAMKYIGSDYEELMSVKDDDESDLKVLARPSDPGYVQDLLIIGKDDADFVLVNITGKINVDDLKNLSNHINIKDLDHLDQKHDHDDDDDNNN